MAASNRVSLSDGEQAELLAKVRCGDRDAFGALFDALFPIVVRLAYQYVQSIDTADDLAQEAFVTLWDERERWRWSGTVLGYLQLIVRRRAVDIIRRDVAAARRETEWSATRAQRDETISPDIATHDAILRGHVERAIAQLPPRARAVVTTRWIEELSREETAQTLGVSVRTVDAHLQIAAKLVRQALERFRESPKP